MIDLVRQFAQQRIPDDTWSDLVHALGYPSKQSLTIRAHVRDVFEAARCGGG